MNRAKLRIGGLCGLAAAALVAGSAAPAMQAQQTTPTPTPPPAPAPSRSPSVIYLPNSTLDRFTLGTPATPAPTPAPTSTPTAVAPAAAARTAPARSETRPAPAATRAPAPAATPAPAPAEPLAGAAATDTVPVTPAPVATVAPTPPSPQPAVLEAPAPGMPGWLWALFGAGATALAFGGVWALRRRRVGPQEEQFAAAPVPLPPTPAPPAPARVAPPPGIAPRPAPAAAPSGEPFEILIRPSGIEVTDRDVLLDFELLLGNVQPAAAENIRIAMTMMSASPDQDRNIAGYHASPMVDPAVPPFDLAAGGGGRLPVRLALPRELIHVVQVHGRPMFVPVVMIEVKWRAGISIRRFGADFMVGTAGQGAKLGPIWLDRNQQASQLAATRYLPREAVAA